MTENFQINGIIDYIQQKAPNLFITLNKTGVIVKMNRFAKNLVGMQFIGGPFQDVILDFQQTFNLNQVIKSADKAHLLNVKAQNGPPQSFQFYFYSSGKDILVLGHMDIDEMGSISDELISANQDLNNLARQLNTKNRELDRANTKILEISRIDPLTQLANRRYFNERIKEMISLADRKSQPLSLIMTDIDKFKNVNDTFGHDAGDIVLTGYAELMTAETRQEDLVARFGGEEFIILLPSTQIDTAVIIAERIRKKLSTINFLGNDRFVTASYGVSQLKKGETMENIIKRADTALYKAKRSGRNQTIIAQKHM